MTSARTPRLSARVDVGHQRPVVVDTHRLGRKSQRGKKIQQVGPARIFDRDPVARTQVRGERALDAVQRPAGHREVIGRDAVRGQGGAGVVGQFWRHRRFAVQQRPALRNPSGPDGQHRGVRVAGRQVARARGARRGRAATGAWWRAGSALGCRAARRFRRLRDRAAGGRRRPRCWHSRRVGRPVPEPAATGRPAPERPREMASSTLSAIASAPEPAIMYCTGTVIIMYYYK